MRFEKKSRHVDPEFLRSIKELPCSVCLAPPPSDPSHIKTVGSGGGDTGWNVIPHCRRHHAEWHKSGPIKFCEEHPKFYGVISYLGWRREGKGLVHHPELIGKEEA